MWRVFLGDADLKPHRVEYWLNSRPANPEHFEEQVKEICDIYKEAPQLYEEGVHVVSVDEKTGIQALERAHPTLPMNGGMVERQEYEYVRHGTQSLIGSFEVATGEVIHASIGPTRTETDFVEHVAQTIDKDPEADWVIVSDQLDTHQSESLVRLVAERCEDKTDLGVKGKKGILKSKVSRKAYLKNRAHRIRFIYTPKHSSWLNQIEMWFSILVRRLLKRASFRSVDELKASILAFIDYFNKTMAKPFRWTYTGRPLVA
jgi:transposase